MQVESQHHTLDQMTLEDQAIPGGYPASAGQQDLARNAENGSAKTVEAANIQWDKDLPPWG